MKRLLFIVLASISCGLALGSGVCNFTINPGYSGSGGCTDDNCSRIGGCYDGAIGPTHYFCSANGAGCCGCYWWSVTCMCPLNNSTGRHATQHSCADGTCGPKGICICKAQVDPTEP